jgi:hypothetical protein
MKSDQVASFPLCKRGIEGDLNSISSNKGQEAEE